MTAIRAVVTQSGPREHFLIPRAFQRRGALARLVTGWYAPAAGRLGDHLSHSKLGPLARAFAAQHSELPRDQVTAFVWWGLWQRLVGRAHGKRRSVYDLWMRSDSAFARRVARLSLPAHNVFFAYSYAALEALEAERGRGVFTVVDQIDPAKVGYDLVREETRRWPEYAVLEDDRPAAYFARARAEWDCADLVVVNSEWSRDALVAQGAPADKIEVLPLAFDPPLSVGPAVAPSAPPLKVLWVGSAIIGKGIHYLLQAVRMLEHEPVEITVAGPIGITQKAVCDAPRNVRWLGAVPRGLVSEVYQSHHVFVLPTLSDGFAITQLEALAYGLPVIVTPNCAHVVRDGQTGFVIPPRDPEALAAAIRRFVREPALHREMRPRCLAAAGNYTVDAYSHRLVEVIERHLRHHSSRPLPT